MLVLLVVGLSGRQTLQGYLLCPCHDDESVISSSLLSFFNTGVLSLEFTSLSYKTSHSKKGMAISYSPADNVPKESADKGVTDCCPVWINSYPVCFSQKEKPPQLVFFFYSEALHRNIGFNPNT